MQFVCLLIVWLFFAIFPEPQWNDHNWRKSERYNENIDKPELVLISLLNLACFITILRWTGRNPFVRCSAEFFRIFDLISINLCWLYANGKRKFAE